MAKIQFFHVGFGQKDGLGLVHIDGNRAFYRAYSRGVKGAPIGKICVLLMGALSFKSTFRLIFPSKGKNGVKIISNVRLCVWFQKDADVFNAGRVGSPPSLDSVFVALVGGNHDDSGAVLNPY